MGNSFIKWKTLVRWCAILYGVYSFFLLIEVLDFLSLLHTKTPNQTPTYTLINVVYVIIEMIICLVMTFYYAVLPLPTFSKSYRKTLYGGLLVLVFRIVMVYYLYIYTTPEYRWVPYIYKTANALSDFMRIVFLPLPIILGVIASWFWWKNRKNLHP